MSELLGDISTQAPVDTTPVTDDDQFETDVEGVKADGYVSQGTNKFPKFNVTSNEFHQNMQDGRRRLRFKSGSNVQQYMHNTKYKIPFYISYQDDKGKTYTRKIK